MLDSISLFLFESLETRPIIIKIEKNSKGQKMEGVFNVDEREKQAITDNNLSLPEVKIEVVSDNDSFIE